MRRFRFTLRLRDGRIVHAEATAHTWQWQPAFSKACMSVEDRLGLDRWSGIVCVEYASTQLDPITSLDPSVRLPLDMAA